MDYAQYYSTTLLNAAKNLGPTILLLVVGYVIFFKLSYIQTKTKENPLPQAQPPGQKDEPAQAKAQFKEEVKEEQKQKYQEEPKKEKAKKEASQKKSVQPSRDEMIFSLRAGEKFTEKELKKRYHNLLRNHHPDKVSQLSETQKKKAELKTKEINSAYENLKKKAS